MFEYYIVTKGKLLFEFAGLFAGPCNFVFKGCVRYIFLVYSLCLKESTCETRKTVFYFTSKALLVLEIIKF